MRIGELSERSGVSRDTIRFYERNGLIVSTAGEAETNNYRVYAEDSLQVLNFLTGAREAGLSIADLRELLSAVRGQCRADAAARVIELKVAELNARADQIAKAVAYLTQVLQQIR